MPSSPLFWKLTTLVSLGLAAFFALSSLRSPRVIVTTANARAREASSLRGPLLAWGAESSGNAAPAPAGADDDIDRPQTVDEIAAALAAARASARGQLIAALGETHDDAAIPILLALVEKRRDADVAVSALGALDTPGARAALLSLARQDRGSVRALALEPLMRNDATRADARAIALRLVHEEGGAIAAAALRALAADASPEGTAMLAAIAGDAASPLRAQALEALVARDDVDARAAVVELAEREPSADLIGALSGKDDPRAVAVLARASASSDETVRASALYALASVDSPDAARAIESAANSDDAARRLDAVTAISERDAPDDGKLLESLARDVDARVASAALGALAASDPSRAGPMIEEAISASDATRQRDALSAASRLPPDAALGIFTQALDRADDETAAIAMRELAQIGGLDAQRAIYARMTAPGSSVATAGAAAEALVAIGGETARRDATEIARYRDAAERQTASAEGDGDVDGPSVE